MNLDVTAGVVSPVELVEVEPAREAFGSAHPQGLLPVPLTALVCHVRPDSPATFFLWKEWSPCRAVRGFFGRNVAFDVSAERFRVEEEQRGAVCSALVMPE